jgi:hypothetical protein
MDSQHLYEELRKIDDKLDDLTVVLAQNTVMLKEYKDRSDVHERDIQKLKSDNDKIKGFLTISALIVGLASTVLSFILKR